MGRLFNPSGKPTPRGDTSGGRINFKELDKLLAEDIKLQEQEERRAKSRSYLQSEEATKPIGRHTRLIDRPGDVFSGIGEFASGSNERFIGGAGRAITNVNPFLKKEQKEAVNKAFFPEATEEEKKSKLFRAGQTAGTIQKGALDTALTVLPGSATSKVIRGAGATGRLGRIGAEVGGGLVSTGAQSSQQVGRGEDVNLAREAAIGAGLDIATLGFGSTAKRLAGLRKPVVAIAGDGLTPITREFDKLGKPIAQDVDKEVMRIRNIGKNIIATEAPHEAGKLKRAVISVKGQLSGLGQGGKELATRLDAAESVAETSVGRWSLEAPTALKLGKKDFTRFVDSLEQLRAGKTPVMNPRVAQAVQEWSSLAPKIRQEAIEAGVDVGDLGPYYFPKNYSKTLSKGAGLDRAAQHLVDTGQFENFGEALDYLRLSQKAIKARPYGHLELSRNIDLPDFDKSKSALAEYLHYSGQRIGHAKNFGANDEIANELIDVVKKEGFDASRAKQNFNIAIGKTEYGQYRKNVSSAVRQFNALRSLRNAAISNAGQSVNTATVSGWLNTVGSIPKLFTPSTRRYVTETGVTADAVITGIMKQQGFDKGIATTAASPFFRRIENFNRSLAAVAGENWAQKLAARGNIKQLRKLGVTGDIGETLTHEQAIQASRKLVERTQFKVGAKDLPAWADSPEGKLAMQFRTFAYKQTGFMANEVLKPLSEGNPLPLVRFMAALPIGLGIYYGKNAAKTKLEGGKDYTKDDSWTDIVMEAYQSLGALGLGQDVKFAADQVGKYGSGLEESIAGSIGGPTAGYIAGTFFDLKDARQGQPTGLQRRGLEAVTGPVGKALSNRLLPYPDKSLSSKLPDQKLGEALESLSREVGTKPQVPDKKQRGKDLSDAEYTKYSDLYYRYYQEELSKALASDRFKKAPTDEKKKELTSIATDAGNRARDEMFGKAKKSNKRNSLR